MSVLFATTYPDRVPPGSFRRPSPHRRLVSPSFSPAEADERLANLVKRWGSGSFLANVFASEASNPDAAARIAKFEKLACSPGAKRSYIISNRRIDVNAILPCVRAPTLILHRATEAQVPVALGRKMAAGIPGVKYIEYPSGDHAFWTGDTETLVGDIEEFVTGHRQAGDTDLERILATVMFTDISTPRGRRSK